MEIQKASIYGFGKWVHFDLDFARGMCLFGENESGKSTIHQFILFMLFGLPPKQRAFFQPKMGAQLGGRMTIQDEIIGEFTIERLDHVKNGAATCYTPDGMEYDEDWLKEQLKGTTLATYQSIFSFSAMDLSGITSMNETDLSEMILGIGLTGSTEIYHLEKQLDNKLGDLFKPFGKKPKINQQLDQLEKRYATLLDYKENEATYREKKLREMQLEERREKLHTEWQEEKRNLSNLEKHMQALPLLIDYKQYDHQLQSYEKDSFFPENGMKRLENLKQSLLPLQSELSILRENEVKYKEIIDQLQKSSADPEFYRAVEKLSDDKEAFLADQKEIERVESRIGSKRLEIEVELDRLNIGLSIEQVNNTLFPFHLEKTWTQIKHDAEQLFLEKEKLQFELSELKQERNDIYEKLEEIEEHVLSDESLLGIKEKLNSTRELEVIQRLEEEADQRQKTWDKRKKEKEKNTQLFLLGSLALAIVLSIVGFVMKIDWLPMIGFIVLLLGIGQWIVGRKSLKEWDEIKSISLSSFQTPYSKEEIREAEMKILKHNKHVNEMETLKEKLEMNDRKRTRVRENIKAMEGKEQKVNNQRNEQIRAYPFLQMVDTAFWPEFFHTMKQLISSSKSYVQEIKERDLLQTRLEKCKRKLDDFFKKYQWELPESIEQQWKMLETFLVKQQEAAQERKQYANFLHGNKEEQKEVVQRIETYEKEMKSLYRVAQVETEEEFYQRARGIEERTQLEETLRKTANQLERIFPNESWKVFLSNLKTEKDVEWRKIETQEKVKVIEDKMVAMERELAKLGTQLENMESETAYSDHLHQYELEQEQLKKLTEEWAILKVAKELMAQTMRAYQEKHLQQVLDKTSNYFEQLTGKKYSKIFPPSDTKGFQVETEEGIRFSVNELSKGTMDQLYVSLRLAIGQVLSEKNQLPFIIDDAFLHFDTIRTKRILEILEEISMSRQVILFTCKEDVAQASNRLAKTDLVNSIRIN